MKYSQRIQELPPDERPYEKCLHSGPEKLTDSELLAVVLRSGTRGSSSVQLADEVLHLGQNEQGPVSYTHLDVYKRQGRYLSEFKNPGKILAGTAGSRRERKNRYPESEDQI